MGVPTNADARTRRLAGRQRGWARTPQRATCLLPSVSMEIMGVQIRTIIKDNVAIRCDGCREVIDGTPWRVNLLDIVSPEVAVGWTEQAPINPGPHQFHSDAACVRRWMAEDTGRTLLLTTHYMVEAEDLCDRVAIISGGRVLACDSPANLKRELRREAIFHVEVSPIDGGGAGFLSDHPGVHHATHHPGDGVSRLEAPALVRRNDERLQQLAYARGERRRPGRRVLHVVKRLRKAAEVVNRSRRIGPG